jgi:hypothetical protein
MGARSSQAVRKTNRGCSDCRFARLIGYDGGMNRSIFSKQLLLPVLWIGIGLICLAFSTSPGKLYRQTIEDNVSQVIRVSAWVVGFVCIFTGIIILITKRRRVTVLILTLCAVILGAMVGMVIADAIYPERNHKGDDVNLEMQRNGADTIIYTAMATGSASVLFLAGIASKHKATAQPKES